MYDTLDEGTVTSGYSGSSPVVASFQNDLINLRVYGTIFSILVAVRLEWHFLGVKTGATISGFDSTCGHKTYLGTFKTAAGKRKVQKVPYLFRNEIFIN